MPSAARGPKTGRRIKKPAHPEGKASAFPFYAGRRGPAAAPGGGGAAGERGGYFVYSGRGV